MTPYFHKIHSCTPILLLPTRPLIYPSVFLLVPHLYYLLLHLAIPGSICPPTPAPTHGRYFLNATFLNLTLRPSRIWPQLTSPVAATVIPPSHSPQSHPKVLMVWDPQALIWIHCCFGQDAFYSVLPLGEALDPPRPSNGAASPSTAFWLFRLNPSFLGSHCTFPKSYLCLHLTLDFSRGGTPFSPSLLFPCNLVPGT